MKKLTNILLSVLVGMALFSILAVPLIGWLVPSRTAQKPAKAVEQREASFRLLTVLRENGFSCYQVLIDSESQTVSVMPISAETALPCGKTVSECFTYGGATFLSAQLSDAGLFNFDAYVVLHENQMISFLDAIGGTVVTVGPGTYANRTYSQEVSVYIDGATYPSAIENYGESTVLAATVRSVIGADETAFDENFSALCTYAQTNLSMATLKSREKHRDRFRKEKP